MTNWNLPRHIAVLGLTALLSVSTAEAEQADEDSSAKQALAERLVELQSLEAFFQSEWDFQMQMMEEAMEEHPEAQGMIPEGYMEAIRQQQVDGQVSDWVEAWSMAFDERRLQELVDYLEMPESQSWIAARLEAYPFFLESMATRAKAMADVFREEYTAESGKGADSRARLDEIDPVVDVRFEDLLEFAPGARIPAELDTQWYSDMRIPANHPVINDVFRDLQIQLVPDGKQNARVARISAERAFSDIESCEAARSGLEQSLASYFPDTEETDCGHVRYLAAGGDIRMTLSCSDQKAVAASRLRFSVSHKPTEDGAHQAFMAQMEREQPSAEGEDASDDFQN